MWGCHKSTSIDLLLEHMESSAMCKESIKICDGCLLKFPDETSLLKHLSLKKKCQEVYDSGLMDPSIVSYQLSSGGDKDVASKVSYYYSVGKKRKQLKHLETSTEANEIPTTNSYAAYVFPRHPDNISPYTSAEQSMRYKNLDSGEMSTSSDAN